MFDKWACSFSGGSPALQEKERLFYTFYILSAFLSRPSSLRKSRYRWIQLCQMRPMTICMAIYSLMPSVVVGLIASYMRNTLFLVAIVGEKFTRSKRSDVCKKVRLDLVGLSDFCIYIHWISWRKEKYGIAPKEYTFQLTYSQLDAQKRKSSNVSSPKKILKSQVYVRSLTAEIL